MKPIREIQHNGLRRALIFPIAVIVVLLTLADEALEMVAAVVLFVTFGDWSYEGNDWQEMRRQLKLIWEGE